MSEELIKSLNAEITKLNAEAKRYRLKAKDAVTKLAEVEKAHQEQTTAFEELKSTSTARPSELEEQVRSLKTQLATRDHKDAFNKAASEAGVRADGLEDAWRLADYKVSEAAPDGEAIKGVLTKLLERSPYLKGEKTLTEVQALKPGPGVSAGSTVDVTEGKWQVRQSQISDRKWMHENQKRFQKEMAAGKVQIIRDMGFQQ
jgi:chromosome segregation ATPase